MSSDPFLYAHPFEDPEYVRNVLDRLKGIDWTGKYFEDVVREYRNTLFTVPVYPIKMNKGTIIFRGRMNDRHKGTQFDNLRELGIKNSSLVDSFGRANIPGESVFYASTTEETVVREVTQWYVNDSGRAQDLITKGIMNKNWDAVTSMMTISAWELEEDLNLALLFGNEAKRGQWIEKCGRDRDEVVGSGENYTKSKKMIIDFFSNEFGKLEVKNQYEYLYSAYYAFEVFRNTQTDLPSEHFDGVQFASIANDCQGENIAISAAAYAKKIKFLGANFCYTLNNGSGSIDGGGAAMIGRVFAALQLPDNSFTWVNSENDFNYLIRMGIGYEKRLFPNNGSRFPLAVTRVNC
jgi:hypothetical protein